MKTKPMISLAAIAAVSLLMSLSADAADKTAAGPRQNFVPKRSLGTNDPRIQAREANQERRIQQGEKSGQLTPGEASTLEGEEGSIRSKEQDFKSDGNLTAKERRQLERELNEASLDIYRDKHNSETQPGVTPAQPGKLGTKDPGVNQRQVRQWHRIFTGMRSGQLTWREANRLIAKEELLARIERRMKSDDTLTVTERARLQKILNELSVDIYKQKHDGQSR